MDNDMERNIIQEHKELLETSDHLILGKDTPGMLSMHLLWQNRSERPIIARSTYPMTTSRACSSSSQIDEFSKWGATTWVCLSKACTGRSGGLQCKAYMG